MLGLALGISTGLFFGEPMGALAIVGEVFVRLLLAAVVQARCPRIAVPGKKLHGFQGNPLIQEIRYAHHPKRMRRIVGG